MARAPVDGPLAATVRRTCGAIRRASDTSQASRHGACHDRRRRPPRALPHAQRALAFDSRWILIGVPVALVVWLALVPLVFLLWQSFLTPQTAARAGASSRSTTSAPPISAPRPRGCSSIRCSSRPAPALFALVRRHRARLDERAHQHAVQDAVLRAVDHPAGHPRHPVHGGVDPARRARRSGSSTSRCRSSFGTDTVFVNIYSMAGMIWVDGLHYSPMAFLLMTAAFRSMDPSLEESALMSGAIDPADRLARSRCSSPGRRCFAHAADPVRARDRVVRGAGAARPAGRHPRLHLGDLPGDPPVSEPDRARRRPTR